MTLAMNEDRSRSDRLVRLTPDPEGARERWYARLLTRFGLKDAMHRPVVHFSRGMLQRVVLCRALLHDPAILILDEPYAGLDDDGVAAVNTVLREARKDGRSALVIAHGRERAQPVVTRTVRLREGRIEAA